MKENGKLYEVPNSGGNVWPDDECPAYTPREGSIDSVKGCWYCKYADFHLTTDKALDVGICNWPKKVIK